MAMSSFIEDNILYSYQETFLELEKSFKWNLMYMFISLFMHFHFITTLIFFLFRVALFDYTCVIAYVYI